MRRGKKGKGKGIRKDFIKVGTITFWDVEKKEKRGGKKGGREEKGNKRKHRNPLNGEGSGGNKEGKGKEEWKINRVKDSEKSERRKMEKLDSG
ncbi:hypothetical protein Tco_0646033 [Tanacetum coccineum]